MKSKTITAALRGPVTISIHRPSSVLKWLGLACLLVVSFLSPDARAQLVADGATNTITTATNLGAGNLTVGRNGGNTELNIIALGSVNNVRGDIGYNASSTNSAVTVQNSGALWTGSGTLSIGNSGIDNQLVVSNSATVTSSGGSLGADNAANNNAAVITGAGS